jgi:hypothetical protein
LVWDGKRSMHAKMIVSCFAMSRRMLTSVQSVKSRAIKCVVIQERLPMG